MEYRKKNTIAKVKHIDDLSGFLKNEDFIRKSDFIV